MLTMSQIDARQLRDLIASGKPAREIAPIVGATRKVVIHAARKHGITWPSPKGSSRACMHRPVPDDFATVAAILTAGELSRHYRSNWKTVMRWFEETGVTRFRNDARPQRIDLPRNLMTSRPGMSARQVAAVTGISAALIYARLRDGSVDRPPVTCAMESVPNPAAAGIPKGVVQHIWRDDSDAGQAVDFLRRFGPISKRGDCWLRGSTLMTGAELIALAERKGWKPWRIAA